MIKTLLLVSTVFILCNCAAGKPVSEPAQVVHADTPPAQIDSSPELAKSDTSLELTKVDGDMEVVEVEAVKEKRCTTVVRTGSHLRSKHCRSKTEKTQEREASRAWLDSIKNQPQGLASGQKG